MAISWREQLSVGNNVIDSDHKHLIDIINRIEKSLLEKHRNGLTAELEELTQYSLLHFEREEKIAKAAGYTQVPTLNISHVSLMTRLEQMRAKFDVAGADWSSSATEDFTQFLRTWLIDHVIKEDLLMKPVLQRLSPAFDPR